MCAFCLQNCAKEETGKRYLCKQCNHTNAAPANSEHTNPKISKKVSLNNNISLEKEWNGCIENTPEKSKLLHSKFDQLFFLKNL